MQQESAMQSIKITFIVNLIIEKTSAGDKVVVIYQ